MKGKILAAIAATALFTSTANAALYISEVVDGDLPGGLPKFVELTNSGVTSVDLSGYSIGNYNNGGTTLGGGISLVLSGTLTAGDSYVISYEANDAPGVGTFFTTYGFDPDNFTNGAFTNGDDAYALFLADGDGPSGEANGDGSDATLVDVYGVVGMDGSGEVWEYTDGYSCRLDSVTSANTTFTPPEWFFGGAASLDAPTAPEQTALLLAHTTPGVASCVPEPATMALLGLGVIGLIRRRR